MLTRGSGQNSVLDASLIDVCNVVVHESEPQGSLYVANDATVVFVFEGLRLDCAIFVDCADGEEVAKSLVCR